MTKPTVTFSINDRPTGRLDDSTFGPDYAGSFVCRLPTLDEARVSLPLRVTARAQREGAVDASGAPMPTYLYVQARVWLDALSTVVPDWYEPVQKEQADDDDVLYVAVLSSYTALIEALNDRKKKRVKTSDTPSPPTLAVAGTN